MGTNHIPIASRNIADPDIDFISTTDESEMGWSATDGHSPTGGRSELKAIFFALKSYHGKWYKSKHIRTKCDNTTAIAYINNIGGSVSKECNK